MCPVEPNYFFNMYYLFIIFFKNSFIIYLFYFWFAGSLLLCELFSGCSKWGGVVVCGVLIAVPFLVEYHL